MVLRRGRPHLTSLLTAMELVLFQDKARLQRHVTGINPTFTDHKAKPPKVVTEELDGAVEASAEDQVEADQETENGSMASTSQVHQTHA
jgi:hypothetical protein